MTFGAYIELQRNSKGENSLCDFCSVKTSIHCSDWNELCGPRGGGSSPTWLCDLGPSFHLSKPQCPVPLRHCISVQTPRWCRSCWFAAGTLSSKAPEQTKWGLNVTCFLKLINAPNIISIKHNLFWILGENWQADSKIYIQKAENSWDNLDWE